MADAKPSRPGNTDAPQEEPKGPGAKSKPAPKPTNGYIRKREDGSVWFRTYESATRFTEHRVDGPGRTLPEGVKQEDISDE